MHTCMQCLGPRISARWSKHFKCAVPHRVRGRAHPEVGCSPVAAAYEQLWVVQVIQALLLKQLVVGCDGAHVVPLPVQARRFGVQLRQGPVLKSGIRSLGLLDRS